MNEQTDPGIWTGCHLYQWHSSCLFHGLLCQVYVDRGFRTSLLEFFRIATPPSYAISALVPDIWNSDMGGVVIVFCIDNYNIYLEGKLRIKSSFTSIKYEICFHNTCKENEFIKKI